MKNVEYCLALKYVKFSSSLYSTVLGFDRVPWWGTLLISLGCALLTAAVVWFIVCPQLKKKIKSKYLIIYPFYFSINFKMPKAWNSGWFFAM